MRKLFALTALAVLICWTGTLWAVIDVNTASNSQLQQLTRVGPKTAVKIIDARKSGGPFKSLSDLARRVKGIGPKTIEKWVASGNVVCNPPGRAAAPATAKPIEKEVPAQKLKLTRTELVKNIADIMKERGYKNYKVNIGAAAAIAEYLEKSGVTLEQE